MAVRTSGRGAGSGSREGRTERKKYAKEIRPEAWIKQTILAAPGHQRLGSQLRRSASCMKHGSCCRQAASEGSQRHALHGWHGCLVKLAGANLVARCPCSTTPLQQHCTQTQHCTINDVVWHALLATGQPPEPRAVPVAAAGIPARWVLAIIAMTLTSASQLHQQPRPSCRAQGLPPPSDLQCNVSILCETYEAMCKIDAKLACDMTRVLQRDSHPSVPMFCRAAR